MTFAIVDASSSCRPSGLRFRALRPGPERELIERFLEAISFDRLDAYKMTIFREPKIESGFPDLVLVLWDSEVARRWNDMRLNLKQQDFRLIHYLSCIGATTDSELKKLYFRDIKRSLERLSEAQMIDRINEKWRAKPLTENFAARHIIAIEAKISEVASALNQALRNTWFATSSHILLPRMPDNIEHAKNATKYGVTIESPSSFQVADLCNSSCAHNSPPVSYASWLFNDWAWRVSMLEKRGQFAKGESCE